MLKDEGKSRKTQLGGIVRKHGEIYGSGPVDGKYVPRNRFDSAEGNLREEEYWTQHKGEGLIFLVHFHHRSGELGKPTPNIDLPMIKQSNAAMYFSNPELMQQGKYEILEPGGQVHVYSFPR